MRKIPNLTQEQAQELLARGLVSRVERKLKYQVIDGWKHCVPESTAPDVLIIDAHGRALGSIATTIEANQSGR